LAIAENQSDGLGDGSQETHRSKIVGNTNLFPNRQGGPSRGKEEAPRHYRKRRLTSGRKNPRGPQGGGWRILAG